jgi:acyl-coenzyme A thioesterase PaaI-like protein
MTDRVPLPAELLPATQANAQALFDALYAPWVKDMGLTDLVVREGHVAMRLPYDRRLAFSSGAICGQALMAAIDTAASMAAVTGSRPCKGTAYQHTHFLRPAIGDDFLIEAKVLRFGKASAYVDCSVTFVGSGELVAHAVLEFAY